MNKELPKKYDHKTTEDKIKKLWEKEKVFEFNFDESKPIYAVDTPPPYVSADHLHSGHIMSYAQAEFIVRYKRMKGFNVFYPMGFDDNGLPTERFVEKKYNIDKSKVTKQEFIKICLEETKKGAQTYKELWTNLGISVDWSKTYSTINPTAIKVSQWSLIDLFQKGALHRSEAPVLWCPHCQTALAQADLEDKEDESKLNYITFKSSEGDDLTIATSRPELLPACVALYVNPEDKRFKHLIGKTATVPLFDYEIPIKPSEKVDMEFGTGLMMVCTWGDQEDLDKWRTDKLDTRPLIKEDGTLGENGGKYKGMYLLKARKVILEDLDAAKFLTKQEDITHSLNVHERCSTATEFVLSKQWFIKIDGMKDVWLKYGEQLNWYPKFKAKDYEMWVNSIKWDWCISRQRYYGVPFPIWYCKKCDEPVFAEEKDLPIHPTEKNAPVDKCSKCDSTDFVPENDVMDTWATSSCTPFLLKELVEEKAKDAVFPVTLRPNAFEIIRTWDFYSMVKSHYHFGKLPFKDVMISGHGLDEKGKKISKRLANYIPADKLIEEFGADAIRYWATGATLGRNLRFNKQEIQKGKKTVTKLWNVAQFLIVNNAEFKAEEQPVLEYADLWIFEELNKTIKRATALFDKYEYSKARDEIDVFFWSKFTDYYMEFIKHRLSGDDDQSKVGAQYCFTKVFENILKMYAPIMPFVTEELFQVFFKDVKGSEKTIHLCAWPEQIDVEGGELDISDFDSAIEAINEVRGFKSVNNMSLGTELPEYKLKTKVDLEKYGDFIKKAIKVGGLLA